VSVVTPSFNQAAYLEATIRSVLTQDYPDLEYLVMDGGSTDGSLEIIRRHAPRLAYWQSQPDAGQAAAINAGFARASGDILAWLNSDDTYEPGAVGAAVAALLAHPEADALYGDCGFVDPAGQLLTLFRGRPFDLAEYVTTEGFIHQPTVFLQRRVLERVGMLDASLRFCMDHDYWLRMAGTCRWLYLPRTLARFRVHPGAKTQAQARDVLAEHLRCLERLFARPDLPAGVRGCRRRAYATAFLAGGVHAYRARNREEARRRLLSALRWDPNPFRAPAVKGLLLLADVMTGLRLGGRVVAWRHRRRWARTKEGGHAG
jgi:glycosyltransferase involved in cell wall biosynthesis